MERFDCLAPETAILGPHFLEASAGTGKTFAVEHIVARLLLEKKVSIGLEQILVVTFTRAAAREIKLRIRSNLQRIVDGAEWDYLKGISPTRIADALAIFDRCQIFTIHGFCHRMLKEFSFEAGISFLQEKVFPSSSPKREAALRDFFEFKLTEDLISAEQLEIVLKWAGSVEDLARKLKNSDPSHSAKLWPERLREFSSVVAQGPMIGLEKLKEDWESLRGCYKKGKGDLTGQVEALALAILQPDNPAYFNRLIEEKGTLFAFFASENKKVKAKEPLFLHYPGFFEWAQKSVFPLIESACNPDEIFNALLSAWKPIDRKVLEEEGSFGPDELLLQMQSALQIDLFRQKVEQRYRAVLIDEFQDTDPVQWDIFQRLFLPNTSAMYLVGDPKQSIYRFRKADLYTYLKAKESIPCEGHFYLDTNFRSCPELIGALNALFNREWLHLPKEKKTIPYLPVKAGLDLRGGYPDEKGAVHCVFFEREGIYETYRYIAREIQKLQGGGSPLRGWAILVKDRYEAAEMQNVLTGAGIPSSLKSQDPLSETLAFEAIVELFEALYDPRHMGKTKTVLAGPFGGYSASQISSLESSVFGKLRDVLNEQGLSSLLKAFVQMRINDASVQERIASFGRQFYSDFYQVVEILFEWERRVGFSFEALFCFFDSIQQAAPEEAIVQRKEEEAQGIQILTMHASKGLEFEIVFALGLGKRTPFGDEEVEAEKQRLLYVAMTRAKKRLYIPIPIESKEAMEGTLSPIELFCKFLSTDGSWEEELFRLSDRTSLTIERIDSEICIQSILTEESSVTLSPFIPLPPYRASSLLSFTSLVKEARPEAEHLQSWTKDGVNRSASQGDKQDDWGGLLDAEEQQLPRGAETGVAIHRMFERIFTESDGCKNVECIVEEELAFERLYPWKEKIVAMIQATLELSLPMGFCLKEIDRRLARVEVEFLFEREPNYLKGFIDLLFMHQGKLYFVDWKTNWLSDYTVQSMKTAVESHRYDLQASIYTEALARTWEGCFEEVFGGAIYLFVRGPAALCLRSEKGRL